MYLHLYLNTLSEILKYFYKYFKYFLLRDDLYSLYMDTLNIITIDNIVHVYLDWKHTYKISAHPWYGHVIILLLHL